MKNFNMQLPRSPEAIKKQKAQLDGLKKTLDDISPEDSPSAAFAFESIEWENEVLNRELEAAEILEKAQSITEEITKHGYDGDYSLLKIKAEKCLSLVEKTLSPEHYAVSIALTNLATVFLSLGQLNEAALASSKAIAAITEPEVVPNLFAAAQLALATSYAALNSNEEAMKILYEIVNFYDPGKELDKVIIYNAKNTLAKVLKDLGRIEEAIEVQLGVIKEARIIATDDTLGLSRLYNNLGILYLETGQFDLANKYILQGYNGLKESIDSNDHPLLVPPLQALTILYVKQGQPEAARKYAEESVRVASKTLGDTHPYTRTSIMNLDNLTQGKPLLKLN